MGCLLTKIECRRSDNPISVTARREAIDTVGIATVRIDTPITVTSSIVCEIAIVDMRYQRYKTRSGKIYRTKSGKIFRVLKKK